MAIDFGAINPLQQSRWRLTLLYAGTMGTLVVCCAIAVDALLTRSYRFDLDHRLEAVAGVLQAGLEPQLQRSLPLAPATATWLRTLCPPQNTCPASAHLTEGSHPHHDGYLRLVKLDGQLIWTVGQGPDGSQVPQAGWQTLTTETRHFRQLSLLLRDRDRQPWGFLLLGRSLQELDRQVQTWRWSLAVVLPTLLGLIGWLSWILAGQALQPVRQSYRQMQQFTADAAHELRTPLAALQATLESHRPEEAVQVWPVLERQTARLQSLTEDLLLLTRLDRQIPALLDSCCLNDLVEEAAATFMPLAQQAGLRLTVRTTEAELFVRGNAAQLYRVLTNLLGNAIAYTPAGGWVQLSLQPDGPWGNIAVQDSGTGIPIAEQTRIFDRFVRLDAARDRQRGGSGLGLAIVKAIVQAHQGRVRLTSALNQGSQFQVQLPLLTISTHLAKHSLLND